MRAPWMSRRRGLLAAASWLGALAVSPANCPLDRPTDPPPPSDEGDGRPRKHVEPCSPLRLAALALAPLFRLCPPRSEISVILAVTYRHPDPHPWFSLKAPEIPLQLPSLRLGQLGDEGGAREFVMEGGKWRGERGREKPPQKGQKKKKHAAHLARWPPLVGYAEAREASVRMNIPHPARVEALRSRIVAK